MIAKVGDQNSHVSDETSSKVTGMTVSTENSSLHSTFPADNIFVRQLREVPPPEEDFRTVHRIRLSALRHNFSCVEAAANKQRCSVIVVVKADGYGHGAVPTALYLADACGADAFAVATLEEGIALRKAFDMNPPGRWSHEISRMFPHGVCPINESCARKMRPSQIRIIVLGPPVGFPRCFDDYFYHGIEVMCSGPEVASALLHWVANENDRKRTEVERAAMEAKERALLAAEIRELPSSMFIEVKQKQRHKDNSAGSTSERRPIARHQSSSLGCVSGQDLAKEVRAILMNQRAQQKWLDTATPGKRRKPTAVSAPVSEYNSASETSSVSSDARSTPVRATTAPPSGNFDRRTFGGIESAARSSRAKEVAAARATLVFEENSEEIVPPSPQSLNNPAILPHRKKLRWHALVDTGMGRLGFRTEFIRREDGMGHRDTVEILREMLDMEIYQNAPIEFYGMVTHMADASSSSDFTNSQIERFTSLLKRVRGADISVPTVSTDNSAALLTTNLTHFDPASILSQAKSDTRGYVRTGGAIYGQRPAFTQLKSISTLMASVRHVAVLKKGESVGYDRAYIAPYDVLIATLTIGFADGYPRELGNGVGRVQIRGEVFPVVGNVCMDMLMVGLGPAGSQKGAAGRITVGDVAVLWGPADEDEKEGMVRLQDIAGTLKTTQSALTCGLDKVRVIRKYV